MKSTKEIIYQQNTTRNNQSIVITPQFSLLSNNGNNQSICVFSFGNELQLFDINQRKIITTIYSPNAIPEDSVTVIECYHFQNNLNTQIPNMIIGLQNGNILHIDLTNKSIYQLYKHESSILSIKYLNNHIFSLSSDGKLLIVQLQHNHQNNQFSVIPINSISMTEKPLSFEIYSDKLLIVESDKIRLFSLQNVLIPNTQQTELCSFESQSLLLKAQLSCDSKFIVCLTKERITICDSTNLSVCTFIVVRNLQREMKTTGSVYDMDMSKYIPCQFVLSFIGGYIMLIEPVDYHLWK